MEVYQFDIPTKTVFDYINKHPRSHIDMLRCLDDKSNGKRRNQPYSADKAYNEYADTCIAYLLECGLVFQINEAGKTYYSISAKGKAYRKYKWWNIFKSALPYVLSLISLAISAVALLTSIIR